MNSYFSQLQGLKRANSCKQSRARELDPPRVSPKLWVYQVVKFQLEKNCSKSWSSTPLGWAHCLCDNVEVSVFAAFLSLVDKKELKNLLWNKIEKKPPSEMPHSISKQALLTCLYPPFSFLIIQSKMLGWKLNSGECFFDRAIKLFNVKTAEAGCLEIVRLSFPTHRDKHSQTYLSKYSSRKIWLILQ